MISFQSLFSLRSKKTKLLFICIFALFGSVALFLTFASTFSISIEPEQGQLSNGAKKINGDSTASGNSYIKFGNVLQGQYILYTSNSGMPTAQIWRMKADGTEATRLTNDPDHEIHWARPSPDGTKILFYKQAKGLGVNDASTNALWTMNSDGTNQKQIFVEGQNGWTHLAHGEWSPDSTKIIQSIGIAKEFHRQLFITNADGSNPVQITQRVTIDGSLASALDPSWPNSNTIVFIRTFNCVIPFLPCGNNDVYKLDLLTGAETRLTNDTDLNFDPYLSPDGKTYVWLVWNCLLCQADLYKADASASPPFIKQTLISDGGVNANGTFSPDSQYFIYSKRVSAWTAEGLKMWNTIYKIKLDGTDLTRVSKSNDMSHEETPGYY